MSLLTSWLKTSIASLLLALNVASCIADTYKCTQPDGKAIYQNWPCTSKPEVERKTTPKPDYSKVVACGVVDGVNGTVAAVSGQKAKRQDCSKE